MSTDIDLNQLGYDLHQRLLNNDVTATAKIAEAFIEPLTDNLYKKFPNLGDPHLVDEAVADALLNYFDRPSQYDPTKRSLIGYLYMSARGDLLNLLEKHRKEDTTLISAESVEYSDKNSEHGVEIPEPSDLETSVLTNLSPIWQRLTEILPDSLDQEIAHLIMENERRTEMYADVLGILDLPFDEQKTIVKRHKDRIKKRLQRNFNLSELKEDD